MTKNNNPFRTYTVTVSQTLSKTVKVETNKYVSMILQNPKTGELSEFDAIDHINWKEVFEEQHWSITSLLNVLKEYVKNDMVNHTTDRGQRQLEALYLACDNWSEDEYEVIKE